MKKLTLLLMLCFSPCATGAGLPDLGDISQTVLTPLQERQIGQQSMLQIRASNQYLDDSEVNDYLNQIGRKLVENSAEPGQDFEFFALNDYNIALRLNPNVPPAYLDRAKVHEALGNSIDALRDYAQSCQMGMAEGCAKSAQ